ncbi:Zn-ribbon domain-containing OB-fold protein [Candidatus Bathyarchaeota archaeon]|nr:Zn-ribbon domain-containing OB-fold protein [Candidatus Bathyarchaeota archaeon]
MAEASLPFTIESFYKLIAEGKLMAAKCRQCGKLFVPPRPMCTDCYSKDLEWTQLKGEGELLTYTIIHVSPKQFESMVPYAVGIVKLTEGPKLPGMICDIEPDKISVGMKLKVDFNTTLPSKWPRWPRYYFKPSDVTS